jgi:hypothetical protein
MAYRRGKTWYCDLRPRGADGAPLLDAKGQPVRIRKRIPNVRYKEEAEKAERKMAARILYGEEEKVIPPIFEDFVRENYLPWARESKRDYAHDEQRAEVLISSRHFKGRRINEFSVIQMENFKRDRRASQTRYKRGRSPATVNAELNLVRGIFRRAISAGLLAANPTADLKNLDVPPYRTRREKAIQRTESLSGLH